MKVTVHPMFLGIHGKMGKLSAYLGRIGTIIRVAKKGKNPQSTYQTTRRSMLKYYSQMWQTLTAADIASWNSAGNMTSKSDKLGTKYSQSGFNLFLGVNAQNRVFGGVIDITTVPSFVVPTDNGPLANVFTTLIPTPTIMTFDVPLVSAGDVLQIYATAIMSAGRSYWKGKEKPIHIYPAGAAQTVASYFAYYTARFGTAVTGKQIAVKSAYYSTVGHSAPVFEAELSGKVK